MAHLDVDYAPISAGRHGFHLLDFKGLRIAQYVKRDSPARVLQTAGLRYLIKRDQP